jgi:hypothetical protein
MRDLISNLEIYCGNFQLSKIMISKTRSSKPIKMKLDFWKIVEV